jgi:hypothetical protein
MKLELKKVKYAEHASQETSNFVAELYVDGKPFAIVGNDGIGGCDYHYRHEKYPSDHSDWHKELENLFKWHKENTTYETEYDPRGYSEGSLDITVGELLDDYLTTKRVKSLMSRSMIVFEKDDPKSGYYKYGKKKYGITEDKMGWFRNQLWERFKDNWVCLNFMPLEEAVAYYKAN